MRKQVSFSPRLYLPSKQSSENISMNRIARMEITLGVQNKTLDFMVMIIRGEDHAVPIFVSGNGEAGML
jgi:hypothetical protein